MGRAKHMMEEGHVRPSARRVAHHPDSGAARFGVRHSAAPASWLLLIAASTLTASCSAPISVVPAETIILNGDYKAISDCAFPRLEKLEGAPLYRQEPRGEVGIFRESGGVRYWELRFAPAGAGKTGVRYFQFQTMLGPHPSPGVLPIARDCAARA